MPSMPVLHFEQGTVVSLGGSGENGRNCFLYRAPRGTLLLDCGVKRELNNPAGIYPALDADVVSEIDGVLLTHCHEDHSVALPLLYALGYTGCIYASPETIAATPKMIRKWMAYCSAHDVPLPFDEGHVQAIRFVPLLRGMNQVMAFQVLAGRSGHTAGSFWYAVGWENQAIWPLFYSGDMCLCSATLAVDMPPRCQAAVLNCAYASSALNQAEQYAALHQIARDTLAQGGHLLLPVPAQGRGCDMLLDLARCLPDAPIYAEESILHSCKALMLQHDWIRTDMADEACLAGVRPISTSAQRNEACQAPCGIYFTTDGMLTTSEGQEYLAHFLHDAANAVVISGHAAAGTPAAQLLDSDWREKHNALIQAYRSVIKVHLDDADALDMCRHLGTAQVMLFHAPQEKCTTLYQQIEQGFSVQNGE